MRARPATPHDAAAIAAIYNEGIEDRSATFETRPRTPEDVRAWFDGRHPIIVIERDGSVVGFAETAPYRPRDCYAGVAEVSVYVAREHRDDLSGVALGAQGCLPRPGRLRARQGCRPRQANQAPHPTR